MGRVGVVELVGVVVVASLLVGCAAAPCREGDPKIRRSGSGWCQGGRKLGNAQLDSLLVGDVASSAPHRRSKVLMEAGVVAIALPSAVFMLSMITLGQFAPPATALAFAVGGDAVGLPLMLVGAGQRYEAMRRFECVHGDTAACGANRTGNVNRGTVDLPE